MFILSSYLGVPVPEDVLGRLGAVPHHTGQVQVVSLLQENVGAAENLSYRLCKGIILITVPGQMSNLQSKGQSASKPLDVDV